MSTSAREATPPVLSSAPEKLQISPEQRRGMRAAVYGQAFGALGFLCFSNGVLLLYMTKQEFSSAAIMFFLALPWLTQSLILLPSAYFADRKGKKKIGVPGTAISASGFLVLTLSGFLPPAMAQYTIALGIMFYAIGQAMFGAGWFALLSPIVPAEIRGTFFGNMRVTWQFVGFLFGVGTTAFLTKDSPMPVFQCILALVTAGMVTRVFFTGHIPELEHPVPNSRPMLDCIGDVMRAPGYASFCCYVFLITLTTANAPTLIGLIEKESLGFGDNAIVWMGNLLMLGCVFGFLFGGRIVDRLGTKPVFLICHFAFGLVLFGVLSRHLLPIPAIVWLGFLSLVYGVISAASSIAISTEMLALIPSENKSLASALCTTLQVAGSAFSGLLSAGAIRLGIFRSDWSFAGAPVTGYDAQLLVFGVAVVILVVALGLVPSVIHKAQWVPKGE
jgi:MFS family permease